MHLSQKVQWSMCAGAGVRSTHSCSPLSFTTTPHNRYSRRLTDETKPHGDTRTCPGKAALNSASSFPFLAHRPVFITTPSQLAFPTVAPHPPCFPHSQLTQCSALDGYQLHLKCRMTPASYRRSSEPHGQALRDLPNLAQPHSSGFTFCQLIPRSSPVLANLRALSRHEVFIHPVF